jgi:hypothetical protein
VSQSLISVASYGDVNAFVLEPLVLISCKFKRYDILSGFIVTTIKMFFLNWDDLGIREREFVYFSIIDVLRYGANMHVQILIDGGIFPLLAQTLQNEIHMLLAIPVALTLDKAIRYPLWIEDDRQVAVIEASGLVESITAIFVLVESKNTKN